MRVVAHHGEIAEVLAELQRLGKIVALVRVRQEVRVAERRGDRGVGRTSIERADAGLDLVDVLVEDFFLVHRIERLDRAANAPRQLAVIAERRAKDARELEVGIGECDVLRSARHSVETRLRDLQRLCLHVGVLARDGELVLQSAQFKIIPRDFGRDAHQNVQPCGFDRTELGTGSLHRTSDATEQIKFPSGVKTRIVEFKFAIPARCTG